ncbi:hypothetical protein [Acidovorax sacchari]|uniref:hypothetical protein n=1 Tax=Acidovorax sacchari TaxID=3230736 RepID=UPI0039E6F8D1
MIEQPPGGECLHIRVRPRLLAAAMLLAGGVLAVLPWTAAVLWMGDPQARARLAAEGPWAMAVLVLWGVLVCGAGIALLRFAPRSRDARLSRLEGTGEALRHFRGAPSVRDMGVILSHIDAIWLRRVPHGRGGLRREELVLRCVHGGPRVLAWAVLPRAGAPSRLDAAARAAGGFLGVPVALDGEPLPPRSAARRRQVRSLQKVAAPPVDTPRLRLPGRCMAAAGAALAALFAAWLAWQVAGAVQTGHLVVHPRAGGARHYDWNAAPGPFAIQLAFTAALAALCALIAWLAAKVTMGGWNRSA